MAPTAPRPNLDPYQPFFAIGIATVLAVVLLWGGRLALPGGGWSLVRAGLHGHWMLWGTVQSFAWGFACTAFPRQQGAPQLARGPLLTLASVHAVGIVAAIAAGLPDAPAAFFTLGLGLQALVGAALWLHLWQARRAAPNDGDPQPAAFLTALGGGVLLMVVHGAGLLAGGDLGLRIVAVVGHLAVAFWLPLLILATAARVVPMFAARGIHAPVRPASRPILRLWFALVLVGAVLTSAAWWRPGLWPAAWAVTLAGAAVAFEWVRRWIPGRAIWRTPMVAYLFAGLFLVILAQGFAGLELVVWSTDGPTAAPRLHRAALHTLGLGGAMTMILAVASRVINGHAGMAMRATPALHVAIVSILAATTLRVAAALRPDWWSWTGTQGAHAVWPLLLGLAFWARTYVPRLTRLVPPNREAPVVSVTEIRAADPAPPTGNSA